MEQFEITPINIDLSEDSNNIPIYVLSDVHRGDPNADLKILEKIISYIESTPDCYCILLGDILNTALTTSKSDIYSETLNVSQAQELAVKYLSRILLQHQRM